MRVSVQFGYFVSMTIIKTLTRSGNSAAVVLDKDLLEAAGIEPGATVEISVIGGIISIGRVRDKKRVAKLKAITKKAHARYGAAFKKLAE